MRKGEKGLLFECSLPIPRFSFLLDSSRRMRRGAIMVKFCWLHCLRAFCGTYIDRFGGSRHKSGMKFVEKIHLLWRVAGFRGFLETILTRCGIKLKTSPEATWRRGINSEIGFWDQYIRTAGAGFDHRLANHFLNPSLPLQDRIVRLLPDEWPAPEILDVGAGPFSFVGKKWDGHVVRLTAVDPLADLYDELLAKHSVQPLVRTEKLDAEKLTSRFAENTFDLVFARNCIDHSYSPEAAIVEMIRVVKPGRYVLLEHFANEAECENYRGLHQWNFCSEQGSFVIWRPGLHLNFTEKYRDLCEVHCELEAGSDRWLITTIRKNGRDSLGASKFS